MIEISGVETRYVKYSVQESDLLIAVEKMLLNSVGLWADDFIEQTYQSEEVVVYRPGNYESVIKVRAATEEDIHIFKLVSEIKKIYYQKPRSE